MSLEDNRTFRFSIIGGKTLGYKVRVGIFIFSICCAIVFIASLALSFERIGGIFGLAFMALFLIGVIGNMMFNKYIIDGEAIIGSEAISISDKRNNLNATYLIDTVSNLNVTYLESQRNIRNGFYGVYGGDGVGNFLEFNDNEGGKHKCELLIDDDRKLKIILSSWQDNGIQFNVNKDSR